MIKRLLSLFRSQKSLEVRAKYDAAQTTKHNQNHWAQADSLAARAAMSPAVRNILRKRSRYEAANNSWYAGVLRTATNHIIGSGPRLQIQTQDAAVNQRIEAAFRKFAVKSGLTEKLRVVCETYWRDGEAFIVKSRVPLSSDYIDLSLRLVEADQVGSSFVHSLTIDPYVDDGIRLNTDMQPIQYEVYVRHPGDIGFTPTLETVQIPASEVAHLWRQERPGQVRGIPRVTPALETFAELREFTVATLDAAKNAALMAMYMTTTMPGVVPAAAPVDFATLDIPRNQMMAMPEGWEPKHFRAEHPMTTYGDFTTNKLMEIGRCLNIPYIVMCGTAKDANFSSHKGDIKNIWEPEVKAEQSRIESMILSKVLSWFFESAVWVPGLLDGAPPVSQIEASWYWDPLPISDEVDDTNAAKSRIAAGLSTLPQELGRRGEDYESMLLRGSQAYGVSVEEFRRSLYLSTFPPQPTQPVTEVPNAVN